MARLTIIENGISSADIHTAINANFAFLNALISDAADIVTITDDMQGQTLLDNINGNFTELNTHASTPISLTFLTLGITGATLNNLFASTNIALGKGMDGSGYFIEYYFSDLHLCTTRGDKILAFDGIDTLSLSLDNGVTYPHILQIVGMEDMIQFAYIFENGNILFCTHTHAYYSEDNLATYHESAVKNADGTSFVKADYDNFRPWSLNQYFKIGNLEIPVWGKYAEDGIAIVWYTIDSGKTLKIAYDNRITSPVLSITHIHAVNYNETTGEFWMQTGDHVQCYWIKGTYNVNTDVWSWTQMAQGDSDEDTYYQTDGFIFDGDDIYIFMEAKERLIKVPYVDILDDTKYVTLRNVAAACVTLGGNYNGEMILKEFGNNYNIIISIDKGESFQVHTLTGGVAPRVDALLQITPKNNQGYYRSDIWAAGETESSVRDSTRGQVLMLRIVK